MHCLKFMIEELLKIADISAIYIEMNWNASLVRLSFAKTI